MILKILLIIGLVALVYFIYKKSQSPKKNIKTDDKAKANDMVECATCGIYCELNDAIVSGSSYYCSKECLEKKR